MNVVPLTVAISVCLVFTFLVFFLREQWSGRVSGAEHDSLLPLADETPRPAAGQRVPADPCGCHDGARPPCAGCLKHRK